VPNPNRLALMVSEFSDLWTRGQTDRRTEGHGKIDSASDPDQEYIYFMGSETLPSVCYILSRD